MSLFPFDLFLSPGGHPHLKLSDGSTCHFIEGGMRSDQIEHMLEAKLLPHKPPLSLDYEGGRCFAGDPGSIPCGRLVIFVIDNDQPLFVDDALYGVEFLFAKDNLSPLNFQKTVSYGDTRILVSRMSYQKKSEAYVVDLRRVKPEIPFEPTVTRQTDRGLEIAVVQLDDDLAVRLIGRVAIVEWPTEGGTVREFEPVDIPCSTDTLRDDTLVGVAREASQAVHARHTQKETPASGVDPASRRFSVGPLETRSLATPQKDDHCNLKMTVVSGRSVHRDGYIVFLTSLRAYVFCEVSDHYHWRVVQGFKLPLLRALSLPPNASDDFLYEQAGRALEIARHHKLPLHKGWAPTHS